MMNLSSLAVAVGLVFNSKGEILIAQRRKNKMLADYWEFPGGKIEPGETPYEALCRELLEEVNIKVLAAQPFMKLQHQYGEIHILLHIWRVLEFVGEPFPLEGQPIQWMPLAHLKTIKLLEANQQIVKKLIETLQSAAG